MYPSPHTDVDQPNGLINLGNTCYANAALQCIATIFGDYFVMGEYAFDVGNFNESDICVLREQDEVLDYLRRYLQWLQKKESTVFPEKEDIKEWPDSLVRDKGVEVFCKNFAYLITAIQNPQGIWKTGCTREYLEKFIFLVKLFKKSDDFFDGRQHDSNDFLAFLIELLSDCMSYEVRLKIFANKQDLVEDDLKTLSRKDRSRVSSYQAWKEEWLLNKAGQTSPTYRISKIAETVYGQQRTFIMCGHEDCDNTSEKFDSFSILSLPINNASTLRECLDDYMKVEVLDGDNMWYCDSCHRKSRATKRLTLWKTAEFVIIHLKRFTSTYNRMMMSIQTTKNEKNVNFPMEDLDLSAYVDEDNERGEVFDLVAVVIHQGSINHGHYICLRKIGENWYVFNDNMVRKLVQVEMLMNGSVYYMIYKRK